MGLQFHCQTKHKPKTKKKTEAQKECKTRQVVFCHHIIIYWSFAGAHLRTWICDHSLYIYIRWFVRCFFFAVWCAGVQNKIYCHRIPWFFLISLYAHIISHLYFIIIIFCFQPHPRLRCMVVVVHSLRHIHTNQQIIGPLMQHTNESHGRFGPVC